MWVNWRHLANMIDLVLPLAYLSPQPKRQINRVSHFCTAHSRKSLYFTMVHPFPPKLLLRKGDLEPHLTNDSLGPFEPTTQMASRLVQPFFVQMTEECPYTLQWDASFPLKIALAMGDLDPHLIHSYLDPPESSPPNGISICSAVFAGLTSVTDWQTMVLGR